MTHTYYLSHRPPSIGCYPTNPQPATIEHYYPTRPVAELGDGWNYHGTISYETRLSLDAVSRYELTPADQIERALLTLYESLHYSLAETRDSLLYWVEDLSVVSPDAPSLTEMRESPSADLRAVMVLYNAGHFRSEQTLDELLAAYAA